MLHCRLSSLRRVFVRCFPFSAWLLPCLSLTSRLLIRRAFVATDESPPDSRACAFSEPVSCFVLCNILLLQTGSVCGVQHRISAVGALFV